MASSHSVTDLEIIPVWISKDEAPTQLSVVGPLFISSLLFRLSRTLLGAWRYSLFRSLYSNFHNRLDLIRKLAFYWVFYFIFPIYPCLFHHPWRFEMDFSPNRLPCGQPYKFRFEANPIWYSAIKFTKLHSAKRSLRKWAWLRRSIKVSSFELYKFDQFSPHNRSIPRELLHSYALGCLWVVTVCCNTIGRHGLSFCRPHSYIFNEQSKMATALTPQTDVTSEKVTWLMEKSRQQSLPAYRK